jgi:hypothetical protein
MRIYRTKSGHFAGISEMSRKETMKKKQPPQTPVYRPSANVAITSHKKLEDLTPQEAASYLSQLKARLVQKQQREKAYLDRRAARGTHTPTDEAYEADQVLENELLAILDDLLQGAQNAGGI